MIISVDDTTGLRNFLEWLLNIAANREGLLSNPDVAVAGRLGEELKRRLELS